MESLVLSIHPITQYHMPQLEDLNQLSINIFPQLSYYLYYNRILLNDHHIDQELGFIQVVFSNFIIIL
jgi:hypothetical protein